MVNRNNKNGFSLIELMVSLSVFAMVMVSAVGVLLTIIDANAKAQALYSAMTNLSFAVDNMSRNIRTGYNYYCANSLPNYPTALPSGSNDCPQNNPGNAIAFSRERDNYRVGYRLTGTTIEQRIVGGGTDTDWRPITAASTNIEEFQLVVEGGSSGDDEQPVASVLIKGFVNNGLDDNTNFVLQTKVTERILNY